MLEAFLRVIDGAHSNAIPWVADISYWIDVQVATGGGPSAWQSELGYLELCAELGCMPYQWYEHWNPYQVAYDSQVDCYERQSAALKSIRWSTSLGEIRKEWTYSPASHSWAPTHYPVQSAEDLKILLYVLRHRRLEPAHLADYRQRMSLWAEYDGLPGIGMTQDPLAQTMIFWAGVTNTAYLMADCPDLMRELYLTMVDQEQNVIDAICELTPPLVHVIDNQSSEIMAGYFEEHMAPRYRRIITNFHAAGIRVVTHIDGTMWPLLTMTESAGFDGAEALTPKPAGDLTAEEIASRVTRDDFVLWGGIPAFMFSATGQQCWPTLRTHLESILEAWQGHLFIVGVGDCVPANGQIELLSKIGDMLA